jgi:hypothetical protein
MKILTICDQQSIAQTAIAEFIANSRFTKITTTPLRLSSTQITDCDCIIYIDRLPNLQVIDKLKGSGRPSILVAELDIQGSQCLFIPFDILDQSISVSIGIDVIRHHLDKLRCSPNDNQRTSAIHQIHQARRELNFFESLAAG